MTCIFTVAGGLGTISTTPGTPANYGPDGTVAEIPFGWVPGDPPYSSVFVTDLPVSSPGSGEIVQGRVASEAISTPPTSEQLGSGLTEIRLDTPTQLGSVTRQLKWRFRIPNVLTNPLTTFDYHYRTHPWTFGILLGYRYYQTAADVATGWTDYHSMLAEFANFGSSVDGFGWQITMLGGGLGTFDLTGVTIPVTGVSLVLNTTDWYIVETQYAPGVWSARFYKDGDPPPSWLSSTAAVVVYADQTTQLYLNAHTFHAAPVAVSYDWIQIFNPGGVIIPVTRTGLFGRSCEFPALINGRDFYTAIDFVPGSVEVTLNGIRQAPDIDFIEHPSSVGSPTDRSHYITLLGTTPITDPNSVYVCYVALP